MSSLDNSTISLEELGVEKLKISSETITDKNEETSDSGTPNSEKVEEKLTENADNINEPKNTQSSNEEKLTGNADNINEPENTQSTNEENELSDVPENSGEKFHISDGSPRILEEDGWLDIIGSGDFKKRIIKEGKGAETRPKQGNSVILNYTCYRDEEETHIEKIENFEFSVGELDIVPGFDLVIPLMEEGEVAEILIPSRLAYGKLGRQPDIPADCPLRYEVEIAKIEEIDEEKLSPSQAMALGDRKRNRGNFWYERGEYLNSVTCYKRATEILDAIQWTDDDAADSSSAMRQSVVEARIKVYNNIAAAQLKLEAFDQALKSLDFVLRLQPQNVKARFRKGKILCAKGLTDEAIAEMKKAAELEPETKVIHQELARLQSRKKVEDKSQRAMYKRMFPSSPTKSKESRIKKWVRHGSVMAGSCVALAIGVAAYRQYYS